MDFAGAVIGLVILGPIMLTLALLIRLTQGAPVLFRQTRAGLEGQPFVLLKFRTMREAVGGNHDFDSDGQRLTVLGRVLRSTSLDEVPALINVLKGEMSLIGPRPLLMVYLDRYTPEQARRHEIKPGITGWAQVNGRNSLTWEEKFDLDVWYVDHWSLWLDFKILMLTFLKVVKREGVSATGHATMPEFRGTSECQRT
jgi:lipopolysaccharide/colanic/teichoic acid biosynthesis glycosyltransferase